MDATLDSGPNWHACLLLSKLDEVSKKLEVTDTWGYYGMPATESPGDMTRKIKKNLSLDVSFLGNHGKFRHEDTRYLDRGHGLHGHTYELNQTQYEQLAAHLKKLESDENAAIEEAATHFQLKPQSEFRIYPYEAWSKQIFQFEKKQAENENKEPRLRAFEIRPGLRYSWSPVHFHKAKTCKSRAVEALSVVLTPEQLRELTEQSPTIPRRSGKKEDILLHSEGDLQKHKKKSGEITHYRPKLGEQGIRVFWSVPPQLIDALSTESAQRLMIDKSNCEKIKILVSQLQQIQWVLLDAKLPNNLVIAQQQAVINDLNTVSQYFSTIPTNTQSADSSTGVNLSLFNHGLDAKTPLDNTESKIAKMQQILDALYDAITKTDDNHPTLSFVKHLNHADIKRICGILERPYSDEKSCVIS